MSYTKRLYESLEQKLSLQERIKILEDKLRQIEILLKGNPPPLWGVFCNKIKKKYFKKVREGYVNKTIWLNEMKEKNPPPSVPTSYTNIIIVKIVIKEKGKDS